MATWSAKLPFNLKFDNLVLRKLPIDPVKENSIRQVTNACFSRVKPTPLQKPVLVAASPACMNLLNVTEGAWYEASAAEVLCGNVVLPGSEPAAHCYCGHQFGSFAGQLGDGAAIYLGEVINTRQERWEIQIKGAGKTPYSRSADGRKVLRSSIREFLCSEAMYFLGIPTTRAASCVTSDTMVDRDIFYNGNVIKERASVVMRVAPTFIRFGSFEIGKGRDSRTGRAGPSAGNAEIIVTLLNYVIETFYPEISEKHSKEKNKEEMYLEFYREIVRRTAVLVAKWQCFGFCHGVLNTDNMSIVGVTIDYGPFGFMDRYDPDFICNDSDNGGRYMYKEQPDICKWNCGKLAEALATCLPFDKSRAALNEVFDGTFNEEYMRGMRGKLGLSTAQESDSDLVKQLLATMEKTGADFTNTFLALSAVQPTGESETALGGVLDQCCDLEQFRSLKKPGAAELERSLMRMLGCSAQQLRAMGVQLVDEDLDQEGDDMKDWTEETKRTKDGEAWSSWLESYRTRLSAEPPAALAERAALMRRNNPVIVLRNYLVEEAIRLAEKGDYTGVRNLLDRLSRPFESGAQEAAAATASQVNMCRPPRWALDLRVT